MGKVTVRELRNQGGRVLERVGKGETLIVTIDGRPVAELRPLPGQAVGASVLLRHWRGLPVVDGARLKSDIDRLLNPGI